MEWVVSDRHDCVRVRDFNVSPALAVNESKLPFTAHGGKGNSTFHRDAKKKLYSLYVTQHK